MKLTINKDFNELYGILSTFLILTNYDFFKIQVEEKWGMKFEIDKDKSLKELSENPVFKEGKYYVDMDLPTKDIFINTGFLRNCKDLEEYFMNLRNQEDGDLKKEIFKALEFDEFIYDIEEASMDLIIEKINMSDFDSDIKWFLLSFIKNPLDYIERFIELIEEYLPIYNQLKDSFRDEYKDFVKWIDDKLVTHGIDYIDQHLEFLNLSQYTEVHLNYSLFDLLSSHVFSDGSIYIYVGIMFKEYVKERKDKLDIDKHLMIYKVLSDKTRFNIIKILINEESYGQEIAKKLGITTATVSYHIDYLMGASLIITKRKSRRLYYSINKDVVKQSISFLKKELSL